MHLYLLKYSTSRVVGGGCLFVCVLKQFDFHNSCDVRVYFEGTLAKCEDNYGYGTMTIKNATHLYWEWQEHGPGNGTLPHKAVTDYLWLIRER
eukprot:m.279530 g.279530  ORF g.279530 m.279530 type:complete len:93 (+) comp15745_c0_seq1:122-400(+)